MSHIQLLSEQKVSSLSLTAYVILLLEAAVSPPPHGRLLSVTAFACFHSPSAEVARHDPIGRAHS
jgi:hypothetical protein